MEDNQKSVCKNLASVFRLLVDNTTEQGVNMFQNGCNEPIDKLSLYMLDVPCEDSKAASIRSCAAMTDMCQDSQFFSIWLNA